MKDLINIKNINNKCFLRCHIRHLNPLKIHPERMKKAETKTWLMILIMKVLNFLFLKEITEKSNKKIIFALIFCDENNLIYPVRISDQKFEDCVDLLVIADKNKSHYVYIKGFNRFMCNKTKCRTKTHFCRYCLQCFTSERVLIEHKESCLKINGKQTVKLKSGLTISCTI